MAATPRESSKSAEDSANRGFKSGKVDSSAPAGDRNSLGEQSIRDGRPATDDRTIEAIDEDEPATTDPLNR